MGEYISYLNDEYLIVLYPDDNSWEGNDGFDEGLPSWDNESGLSGHYDDGHVHNDKEGLDTLISQPRRVCVYSLFLYFLSKDLSESCYSLV